MELCSSIRKEVMVVYPNFSSEARDELSLDYFIGVLRDRDFRIELRRARPNTLKP